jgi:hypothetical protein
MMTPKERISAVVAEWTKSGGRFAGYDGSGLFERLEDALTAAAADAWDEGAHDGKKFVIAENGEWTRAENPYRKGTP